MPKGIPGPIAWQVGRGLRIVAAHWPATGCAPRDFAGCEERGRGGRAAPSELAKRASLPPYRDSATSACTRMSTERTQWPARERQQRTTGRIVLMQTSTAIQKGYSPDRCMHPPGKHPFCPVELTGPNMAVTNLHQKLGDLYGVGCRALANLVAAAKERQ